MNRTEHSFTFNSHLYGPTIIWIEVFSFGTVGNRADIPFYILPTHTNSGSTFTHTHVQPVHIPPCDGRSDYICVYCTKCQKKKKYWKLYNSQSSETFLLCWARKERITIEKKYQIITIYSTVEQTSRLIAIDLTEKHTTPPTHGLFCFLYIQKLQSQKKIYFCESCVRAFVYVQFVCLVFLFNWFGSCAICGVRSFYVHCFFFYFVAK